MAEQYEDRFPRRFGPPPVPDHAGHKLMKATKPTYTVELDSGAFMALWEHMEAEAKRRFSMAPVVTTFDAYLRGVAALRETYWSCHEPPPLPVEKPRKKRLARKAS